MSLLAFGLLSYIAQTQLSLSSSSRGVLEVILEEAVCCGGAGEDLDVLGGTAGRGLTDTVDDIAEGKEAMGVAEDEDMRSSRAGELRPKSRDSCGECSVGGCCCGWQLVAVPADAAPRRRGRVEYGEAVRVGLW